MKCYSLHYRTNSEVTDWYIETIEEALKNAIGMEIDQVTSLSNLSITKKEEWFLVSDIVNFCRLWICGRRNVILWIQGIVPEESYLRNNSKLRYGALSILERTALKYAKYIFFVSEAMKEHYVKKYHVSLNSDRYFIMPCFNEEIEKKQFEKHDYLNNEFVYVGGLSKWQCFDETLDLYKQIETKYENVSLKVLTQNQELAEQMIRKKGIGNYTVKYVPKESIKDELLGAKFGFCIRADMPVNNVATPTKLSSYVCSGVIPIYTSAVRDFSTIAEKSNYCIDIDKNEYMNRIEDLLKTEIEWKDIYRSFHETFDKYYSRKYYVGEIENVIKKALLS